MVLRKLSITFMGYTFRLGRSAVYRLDYYRHRNYGALNLSRARSCTVHIGGYFIKKYTCRASLRFILIEIKNHFYHIFIYGVSWSGSLITFNQSICAVEMAKWPLQMRNYLQL